MKAILAAICAALCVASAETYTVTVRGGDGSVWMSWSNCVSAVQHEPNCWLIQWVDSGRTNEFHAWAARVNVTTNATAKSK